MHTGGGGGSRMLPPKQLLTIIIVIFSTLSFIKLLLLTSSSSGGRASSPRSPAWDAGGGNGTARSALAAKELALLRSLVAARAPCRLLVFGLSPQLLALARPPDDQTPAPRRHQTPRPTGAAPPPPPTV
ncbi:hypothetical protein PVAP13_4NG307838 [Panicum virgatum]|uniref:Uncharacterized protein n=1 Tax=Panicum virgatum TaxID=38727 RepID=A0A8T0TG98_PANVG|nr:hypothetical protein PVAP13_4NG307838 [Panicum virgatum]